MKQLKCIFLLGMLMASVIQTSAATDTSFKTLIVFFDGLRPDYITKELMPNLFSFKQQGSFGAAHHSVFPTVTRVNASSYSTGTYPALNGIMGNTVYFPEVDASKGLNTGEAAELNRIAAATHDRLLTALSLGEVLEAAGESMMVFSSGSTGQALLQNHKVGRGAIVNTSMIIPAAFKSILETTIGPIPAKTKPNANQHRWITDALIRFGLASDGPLVSAIWYSDPDGTAHSDGIGSPTAIAALRSVDEQFGRILNAIQQQGIKEKVNILISSDHGFVTNIGKESVEGYLLKCGLKKNKEDDAVIVAEGAVYVKNHDQALIHAIVDSLQTQEWVGAIFTRSASSGSMKGWVPGTLSFESIHWNHAERAADILVDENWDDRSNTTGYAGTSYSRGVAGHGGLSPYEVTIPLIANGPAFKKQYVSTLPTSNVDLAPTILYLHHIAAPATMKGRIFKELLQQEKQPIPVTKKETIETSVTHANGTYHLVLDISTLNNHRYINFARVVRTTEGQTGQ